MRWLYIGANFIANVCAMRKVHGVPKSDWTHGARAPDAMSVTQISWRRARHQHTGDRAERSEAHEWGDREAEREEKRFERHGGCRCCARVCW